MLMFGFFLMNNRHHPKELAHVVNCNACIRNRNACWQIDIHVYEFSSSFFDIVLNSMQIFCIGYIFFRSSLLRAKHWTQNLTQVGFFANHVLYKLTKALSLLHWMELASFCLLKWQNKNNDNSLIAMTFSTNAAPFLFSPQNLNSKPSGCKLH